MQSSRKSMECFWHLDGKGNKALKATYQHSNFRVGRYGVFFLCATHYLSYVFRYLTRIQRTSTKYWTTAPLFGYIHDLLFSHA
jgi:hypothetical protein